ncbi:hypothetical protein BDQ17DRAFT_1411350 [Cyathus striatus]|nr:hypothetical protein BDQ17DRAFT_1411350 [Cyathus striatus]
MFGIIFVKKASCGYHSVLGHLLDTADTRECVKASIQKIIDDEFLSQLRKCPQDDIFILYYFVQYLSQFGAGEIDWILAHAPLQAKEDLDMHNIMYDIMHDVHQNINGARGISSWFTSLMASSKYIHRLTSDVRGKAMCYLLDVAHNELSDLDSLIMLKLLDLIFEDLPASSTTLTTLVTKWESMDNSSIWGGNNMLKESIGCHLNNYQRKCDLKTMRIFKVFLDNFRNKKKK